MTVTYRDLPIEIDPIHFLTGLEKMTVPESRFTPAMKVRFFDQVMKMVEMQTLHARSDHNPDGLASLSTLLRYEAGTYGKQWLRLKEVKGVIGAALPEGTAYQLLYFPIYQFPLPEWKEIPIVPSKERWGPSKVLGKISSTALLYGKNKKLYLAQAEWSPEKAYYARDAEPRYFDEEEGPYTFCLSKLILEQVEWEDERILSRFSDDTWGDISSFLGRVQLLLMGTATILEQRASGMRGTVAQIEGMSIYYGR